MTHRAVYSSIGPLQSSAVWLGSTEDHAVTIDKPAHIRDTSQTALRKSASIHVSSTERVDYNDIIFWSRGCFLFRVDKNPAKTMSTKSTKINYGRIFSQVPQAARTITIFLLLFTACHVALTHVRGQYTCTSMHCTQDFTAHSIVVSCDESVH